MVSGPAVTVLTWQLAGAAAVAITNEIHHSAIIIIRLAMNSMFVKVMVDDANRLVTQIH